MTDVIHGIRSAIGSSSGSTGQITISTGTASIFEDTRVKDLEKLLTFNDSLIGRGELAKLAESLLTSPEEQEKIDFNKALREL